MRIVKSLVKWLLFYPTTFPLLIILVGICFLIMYFNLNGWFSNGFVKLTDHYVIGCMKLEKKLHNLKRF